MPSSFKVPFTKMSDLSKWNLRLQPREYIFLSLQDKGGTSSHVLRKLQIVSIDDIEISDFFGKG